MDNAESTGQSSTSSSSSKKFVLPLIILIIIAGIVGYIVFGKNLMSPKAQDANTKTTQVSQAPTTSNVITSIKDALVGSQSLKCEFTDEGGRKTTTYMKSGAIRTDFVATDSKQSGSVIMKDKKMYYWSGKQGTILEFDLSEMKENVTSAPKTPNTTGQSPEDVIGSLEKFKEFCKPASVDSVLFVPPTDVKFTDMSQVLKNMKVSATGVPQAMTEEQIKALQEKIQQ